MLIYSYRKVNKGNRVTNLTYFTMPTTVNRR